ncbi:MAG: glycosyltransferase family 39 protein, partial [Planctomycetaceae bacterium]|nr:glycosyltransferase family 39 protein [Planctomycetaceae bacterium]
KKPPLAYWCAAGASWLMGEDAPWAARFPFAVSALLLSGLVGVWAGKWYGRWQGLAAALVQISCVYVISFSRKSEVDMLLCLLTTSALFLVANAQIDEKRLKTFGRWAGIYSLIALAWLAKFHYGPAMVVGVIGVWYVVNRRWPGLWDVFNPLGLLILTAGVVVWPWLLLQRVPEAWDIWQTETVGRALGDLGREPFWFYVPQVFVQALPWSLLLWKAGRDSFKKAWKQGDKRERFLWVWFITQFLILTASAFKHHHYLMAAMPAISLILGRTLVETWQELKAGKITLSMKYAILSAVLFVVGGMGAAFGLSHRWPHLTSADISLGLCLGIGGVLWCLFLRKQLWKSAATTAGVGFVVCYAIVTATIFPNRDRRLPTVAFAEEIREVVSASESVCVFGLKEDPVVYYLPGPKYRLESSEELIQQIEREGSLMVLTDETHANELVREELTVFTELKPDSSHGKTEPFVLVWVSVPMIMMDPPEPARN